ncbi:MAG TPA: cbb3-type cytochrome c oxidase N-terminal domain-containing protein [Vicinamibacterales bacterium]|nr:cbb3-type cytochrome c oxidase N-terminal domain-containing protein [Vicinamibacterales bacterium]
MSANTPEPRRDDLLEHESDGIREFDNALPRWWLYGFYFTILFAVLYMTNYHLLSMPLVGKRGMVEEYQAEMAAAPKPRVPAGGGGVAAAALTDPASLAQGRAIFEGQDNVCSSCHRPDLGGMIGPNLTDDLWLHGCSVQAITASIKSGYPLMGMMPYGTGKPLDDGQVLKVASYILSKQGSAPPAPKPSDAERDKACR